MDNYKEIEFPIVDDLLINVLEKVYPNKLPLEKLTEFEYGKLIGQQEVINKLKYEQEIQKQN